MAGKSKKDPKVELEDSFDPKSPYRTLRCPCGGTYLHAYHVTHYVRHSEDGETFHVGSGPLGPDESPLDNPSGRRDAVGIRFGCEDCNERRELCISQHKGQTFLTWRNLNVPYSKYGR